MFSKPEIKNLLDQYVYVQLYTDTLPAGIQQPASSADENKALLYDRFGSAVLPTYVILDPEGKEGKEIGRFDEGIIRDPKAFAEFLRRPIVTTGGARAHADK